MLMLTEVIGHQDDPGLHSVIHGHEHRGTLEWVSLDRDSLSRRRIRVATDKSTDLAIALPRDANLVNGAVLHLSDARAILVRMEAEEWLRLRPRDTAAALMLGYHAGNLHWRTRFDGDDMLVAVEQTRESYLARLQDFLEDGRAKLIGADDADVAA